MLREFITVLFVSVLIALISFTQLSPSTTTSSASSNMAAKSVLSTLHSIVYVTVPNVTVAKQIARDVVNGKLAACVNILPSVTSIYEWEGKLEEDSELLLIIKTKSSALDKLKSKVIELHPYDVPEFIATPITNGNEAYLKWIDTQVAD